MWNGLNQDDHQNLIRTKTRVSIDNLAVSLAVAYLQQRVFAETRLRTSPYRAGNAKGRRQVTQWGIT